MNPGATQHYREAMRLAHRANGSVERAFALYMALIASRTDPDQAIGQVEKAMEIWQAFEDANRMEMPELPAPRPAVSVFVVCRSCAAGGVQIHHNEDKRLAAFQKREDAEALVAYLGKISKESKPPGAGPWTVGEVGAEFIAIAPAGS